jgi:hypothetical protein
MHKSVFLLPSFILHPQHDPQVQHNCCVGTCRAKGWPPWMLHTPPAALPRHAPENWDATSMPPSGLVAHTARAAPFCHAAFAAGQDMWHTSAYAEGFRRPFRPPSINFELNNGTQNFRHKNLTVVIVMACSIASTERHGHNNIFVVINFHTHSM